MRTFIYVDGENVFYQLVSVLVKAGKIKTRSELTKVDLKWLLSEAVRLNEKPRSIRYYGTKLHVMKGMAFTATQTLTFTREDVIEAFDRVNGQVK